MKYLLSIVILFTFLFSKSVLAEDLKTSGNITILSEYWLQGYQKSDSPFILLRGTVSYGQITGYVESRQSIAGKPEDTHMVGVVDYNINKNILVGYKSYTLQKLNEKQLTDLHIIMKSGAWNLYVYEFITSPIYGTLAKRYDNATYSSLSYTFKPIANTSVKFLTGFGNKAHLKCDQKGFSLVNTEIVVSTKVQENISIINMLTYNPYESDTFSFKKLNYIIGTNIDL